MLKEVLKEDFNETFTLDTEKLVLGAGDYFKVSCSGTNSISVVVSYLEV